MICLMVEVSLEGACVGGREVVGRGRWKFCVWEWNICHTAHDAHSAPIASIPMPALAGFTWSHTQTEKSGGCTSDVGIVKQGPGVLDHHVLHMSFWPL